MTTMGDPENSKNFMIGNAILVVAMILLLYMGSAWAAMGAGAMVLWVALVVAGVTFLMKDKDKN